MTNSRASLDSERGAALPFALLVAILLAMLSSLLIANALMENRASFQSEQHENALHVAEVGVEVAASQVLAFGFDETAASTGQEPPAEGEDEREWAIAIADAVDEECAGAPTDQMNSCVVQTPGGESVFIRPQEGGQPLPTLYGVGYVPSKSNPANVRVLRMDFSEAASALGVEHAFLTGGHLSFSGAASEVLGAGGSVHANGDVVNWNGSTISESLTYGDDGPAEQDSDPEIRGGHIEGIPVITARSLYDSQAAVDLRDAGQWIELCSEGKAFAPEPHSGEPCSDGIELSDEEHGWDYRHGEWESTSSVVDGMVYYVHHADASLKGGTGRPSRPSECSPGAGGPGGGGSGRDARFSVLVEAGDVGGGDLAAAGNISAEPAWSGIFAVADGDVKFTGASNITNEGEPAVVVAGGRIDVGGTFSSEGVAFVARDAEATSEIRGNQCIVFDGVAEAEGIATTSLTRSRWTDLDRQ